MVALIKMKPLLGIFVHWMLDICLLDPTDGCYPWQANWPLCDSHSEDGMILRHWFVIVAAQNDMASADCTSSDILSLHAFRLPSSTPTPSTIHWRSVLKTTISKRMLQERNAWPSSSSWSERLLLLRRRTLSLNSGDLPILSTCWRTGWSRPWCVLGIARRASLGLFFPVGEI